MNFATWFSQQHSAIPFVSAAAVLDLHAEGATIPFIARYRKEQTGNLDEVAIEQTIRAHERWDAISKRQTFIVEEIARQEKLTDELKNKILTTFDLDILEDIYLPYKQKRKTKAAAAKEAGLEPLADWLWDNAHGLIKPETGQSPEDFARLFQAFTATFIDAEKKINDAETALQGAQDILTERLAETEELRRFTRATTFERGFARTVKGDKAGEYSKFERYFAYHETIQRLLQPENSHRYLAMRRGWLEGALTLTIGGAPDDPAYEELLLNTFTNAACTVPDAIGADILLRAARLALKAYVLPSIETEVHRALKDAADEAAIKVFAENVRQLLLSAPFGPKAVLGVDPGIRTGCKLAVVDDSGRFVTSGVIYLQSDAEKQRAQRLLAEILPPARIRAIAVGNGTAGRETETFLRQALKELELSIPVVMVNEAGASIYSASAAAREEFPDLDITVRGAISIARRLQDPLAELVKTDAKSIGVGQYQHDVNQTALKKGLDAVVDSCVNGVGVNLNTASYHLLAHVSGIGPALAKKIVERRATEGLFTSRAELLSVPRFSQKVFEQAAGFLRIPDGPQPLDNTGVHPERYAALESLAARLDKKVGELTGAGVALVKQAQDLRAAVGEFTFADIVAELEKPGRDPREQFQPFVFREDIHELKDLTPGLSCPGIVTNVTNFGAFVDIGVHQDGLVHISQLSHKFVKDPREIVNPGDKVTAYVLEVNLEKRQIALSLRGPAQTFAPVANNERGPSAPSAKDAKRKDKPRQPQGFNNPFAKLGDWKK